MGNLFAAGPLIKHLHKKRKKTVTTKFFKCQHQQRVISNSVGNGAYGFMLWSIIAAAGTKETIVLTVGTFKDKLL